MKLVWWRCGEGDWCLAYVAWIPLLRCLESASEASLPVNGHSTERIQSSAGVPCISSHSSTRTVFVCMQDATTNTGGLGPMCGMGHGCCGTEVARCAGPALALGARGFEKGTSKTLESRPLSLSHACQRPRQGLTDGLTASDGAISDSALASRAGWLVEQVWCGGSKAVCDSASPPSLAKARSMLGWCRVGWKVGSRGLRGEGRAGQLPMPASRNGSVGSWSDAGPVSLLNNRA